MALWDTIYLGLHALTPIPFPTSQFIYPRAVIQNNGEGTILYWRLQEVGDD